MPTKEASHDLRIRRFHFSERLSSVFFPVNLAELVPILEEIGYSVPPVLLSQLRAVPSGVRMDIGGPVATSKDSRSTLTLESARGIVAIDGPEIEQVLRDFAQLEDKVKHTLSVNLESEAQFYEFILDAEVKVEPPRNPTTEIEALWENSPALERLGKLFGWNLTQFGLRLVLPGAVTTDPKWADYRIEPSVPRPKTDYVVNVVYRDLKKTDVVAEANIALKRIDDILSFLSEGG